MRNLYVTDLDGTLLNNELKVSDYSAKIINGLIAEGEKITYSTSRSFYSTEKLLENVRFNLPCVVFNGAYVIDSQTGRVIKENLLDKEAFSKLMRIALKFDVSPFVFGKISQTERLLYSASRNCAQEQFIQERKGRNDQRLLPAHKCQSIDEVITVSFLYPLDIVKRLRSEISDQLGDLFSIKVIRDIYNDGFYSLEVSNKLANKGDMLRYLGELMGVEQAKITVFGDQANDIEMFRVAGTGVAVANASEELKKIADVVIGNNNEDAVANYLMQKHMKG